MEPLTKITCNSPYCNVRRLIMCLTGHFHNVCYHQLDEKEGSQVHITTKELMCATTDDHTHPYIVVFINGTNTYDQNGILEILLTQRGVEIIKCILPNDHVVLTYPDEISYPEKIADFQIKDPTMYHELNQDLKHIVNMVVPM